MSGDPDRTPGDRSVRQPIFVCAVGTLVGIGVSVTELRDLGAWLTVGSFIGLVWSLHRLGRTGPDGVAPRRMTGGAS